MKNIFASIIAGSCLFMTACKKTNATDAGSSNEKGRVKGHVVDTKGNPIANAKVVIENTVLYASYVHATTDGDGFYNTTVPNGSWKVSVQIEKQYLGVNYKFDLHPDNANPFSGSESAERNFSWKLAGAKPEGAGYYGGYVMLYNEPGSVFDIQDVELTLIPVDLLVDGSNGQHIIKKTTKVGGGEDGIADVPLGKYKISAWNTATGESLQVRLRNNGDYSSSIAALFGSGFTGVTTYQIVVQVK